MYYPIMNREIVRYCAQMHMTHRAFADRVGIGDVALREKRTGRRSFTVTEAVAIARIVHMPVEYLCSVARKEPGDVKDYEVRRFPSKTKV